MTSQEMAWKIRKHALSMTYRSGASHIGPALSIADIVAVLYSEVLKLNPKQPDWQDRDYFILSKGHAGIAVYAALALRGFFPEAELEHYYANGSNLCGHVSHKNVPGVELSTGSLGHGLAVGNGLALALRMDKRPNRVFVLLGDGECDEGSIWEAALFAGHHRLSNLVAIIDHNKMQAMGDCSSVANLEPFEDKWKAFNWRTKRVDGHQHDALRHALEPGLTQDSPTCIIADTIKGKGISFMENNLLWHYRNPSEQIVKQALEELEQGPNAQ